ncbi:MAG: class I mannose-6-phosphate isomerase [Planctomycetota bacterium]|nr:class I mannose-6-phosphate isomerase [Planctomycetota bacterium]
MVSAAALVAPLSFKPCYQNVVWGGRRMEQWRDDLPDGPVGESWDISQQERGMSVVDQGPLSGTSLAQLMSDCGADLVGASYDGGDFPLLVKMIDANDRLSVQVHPDDELAVQFDKGPRGKTECWFMLGDGGELFQGTKAGVDAAAFEGGLADGSVPELLNRFDTSDGDFFFLPARTVHALGTGSLLYEVQQSSDCTFRVYDWGRVGLDGKPRETHVAESMATIQFSDQEWGPSGGAAVDHPQGGSVRPLADCAYFSVEERRARSTGGSAAGACSIVILLEGAGTLRTAAGAVSMAPMRSYLVPACAGDWTLDGTEDCRLLVAQPR